MRRGRYGRRHRASRDGRSTRSGPRDLLQAVRGRARLPHPMVAARWICCCATSVGRRGANPRPIAEITRAAPLSPKAKAGADLPAARTLYPEPHSRRWGTRDVVRIHRHHRRCRDDPRIPVGPASRCRWRTSQRGRCARADGAARRAVRWVPPAASLPRRPRSAARPPKRMEVERRVRANDGEAGRHVVAGCGSDPSPMMAGRWRSGGESPWTLSGATGRIPRERGRIGVPAAGRFIFPGGSPSGWGVYPGPSA